MTYQEDMKYIRGLEEEAAGCQGDLAEIRDSLRAAEKDLVQRYPDKVKNGGLRTRLEGALQTRRWRKKRSWNRGDIQMVPEFAVVNDSSLNVVLHFLAKDGIIKRLRTGHYRVSA